MYKIIQHVYKIIHDMWITMWISYNKYMDRVFVGYGIDLEGI